MNLQPLYLITEIKMGQAIRRLGQQLWDGIPLTKTPLEAVVQAREHLISDGAKPDDETQYCLGIVQGYQDLREENSVYVSGNVYVDYCDYAYATYHVIKGTGKHALKLHANDGTLIDENYFKALLPKALYAVKNMTLLEGEDTPRCLEGSVRFTSTIEEAIEAALENKPIRLWAADVLDNPMKANIVKLKSAKTLLHPKQVDRINPVAYAQRRGIYQVVDFEVEPVGEVDFTASTPPHYAAPFNVKLITE